MYPWLLPQTETLLIGRIYGPFRSAKLPGEVKPNCCAIYKDTEQSEKVSYGQTSQAVFKTIANSKVKYQHQMQ